MKNRITTLLIALLFLTGLRQAAAQGTAFTYQGQLDANGAPANGSYDLTFALYATSAGGTPTVGPVTNLATGVTNGLFTVAIDFGAGAFTGTSNWLQIGARASGGGAFTTLAPRQQITPTPYAIYAPNAGLATTAGSANSVAAANVSGTLGLAQLPGAVVTNGQSGVTLTGAFTGNGGSLALTSNGLAFTFAGSYACGLGLFTVVAATNLNGLGHVDLVVPNYNSTVITLTNNGKGGFAILTNLPVGIQPESVAVADVNNDGKPDVISANAAVNTLTVLTNNGNGFGSNATLVVGPTPLFVAAADLNGDGWPDLVSANSGASNLTVLTNNRVGGFGLFATLTVGANPACVIAADLNKSGNKSLVSANSGTNTLSIWLNTGGGSLVSLSPIIVGNGPATLVAVDVNGDGWLDLVCGNRTDGTVTILTNNGPGAFGFTLASTVSGVPSVQQVVAADFLGNGQPDLVCSLGTGTLQMFLNTSNGTFALGPALTPNVNLSAELVGLAAADVNGDGKPDLVTSDINASYVAVLLNDSGAPSTELTLAGQNGGLSLSPGFNGAPNLIGGYASNVVGAGVTGSVIAGGGSAGSVNEVASDYSSIGGGAQNTIESGAEFSTIDGGGTNTIESGAIYSDIGGGSFNVNGGIYSVIGGGILNVNGGTYSVIGGGYENTVSNIAATVAGGYLNSATNAVATVAGGAFNFATGTGSFIGGGGADGNIIQGNMASGGASVVAGGLNNRATNVYATVPGGMNNTAGGVGSFAAGANAQALHGGAFVWSDFEGGKFSSTAANQFAVRASGGAEFVTSGAGMSLDGTLTVSNGPLIVSNAGVGTLQIVNDGGLVPGIWALNPGSGNGGIARFRDWLQIFPNTNGTSSGFLDVRNNSGATIQLNGANGQITASNVTATTFTGSGAGLTSVPAADLTGSGTLPKSVLPSDVALTDASTQTFTGTNVFSSTVSLNASNDLDFGSTTRQMLNLYSTSYGIGVQNFTVFQRSSGGFAWYFNGAYTNDMNNPGPGGTLLMSVSNSGALAVNGTVYAQNFSGSAAGLTNTPTAVDYVYAYDTTTQTIVTANTFQAIAFGSVNLINNWTYAGDVFGCNQTGLYLVQYSAEVETTASGAITITLRGLINGVTEAPGSESVVTMSVANQPTPISKSFVVPLITGQDLVFNIYSTSTSAALVGGVGAGSIRPSISVTIVRIQ